MIIEFNSLCDLGHSANKRIKSIKSIGRSINCKKMVEVIQKSEDMTFPSFYSLDYETKLTKSDIAHLISNAMAGIETANKFETDLLNCLVFMGS